jgi:hypothetical protein
MANEDISSEFRRQNEPLSYYWRAVMSAMDAAISVPQTLQNGFWPFRVGRNVYDGYFLAMRSTDGDLRPIWVACAVSNPNPDPSHRNQIQIQY